MRVIFKSWFFVIALCGSFASNAQVKIIVDNETNEPISDVFVFIDNSSIGTTSDINGNYNLEVNYNLDQTLVYSHINYEILKISINDNYLKSDTIKLILQTKLINEVSVVEKLNPRIRNRRLQRFKETFLGYNYNSKLVQLLNPDVLIFQKTDNKLYAIANEAIKVENKQLGYNLQFFLEKFTLYENDDLFIKGSVFFEPIKGKRKELARFKRAGKKLFKKSSRKFFGMLASGASISEDDYLIGYSSLNNNRKFVHYTPINPDSLLVSKIDEDIFKIEIKRFLTVTVKDVLQSQNNRSGLAPNFSTGLKSIDKDKVQVATSYFKSKRNTILFNSKGHILNPLEIEEYGYWAEQRVADMLPYDYEN